MSVAVVEIVRPNGVSASGGATEGIGLPVVAVMSARASWIDALLERGPASMATAGAGDILEAVAFRDGVDNPFGHATLPARTWSIDYPMSITQVPCSGPETIPNVD
jgi:hypothetical protein